MRFALMTEPQQGLRYSEILAVARAAEAAGFEAYFRSDHYASFPIEGEHTSDAWATLAGLARETQRIRLGTLVSPVTFRNPGNLAKVIQTVDEMSGGRAEVGLGAGWNEAEHRQLGLRFPPLAERYEMLGEQLEILHRLWTDPPGWSLDGAHWQVREALQHGEVASETRRHPHLILGGRGRRRLAGLVARWADEFNLSPATPDGAPAAFARVRDACRELDRDPDTVVLSAMAGVLVAETERELRDRVRQQLETFGERAAADEWLRDRRRRWVMGTPDEARARLDAYEAAGVQRIMLQDWLPRDLDMVDLLGRVFIS